MTKPTRPPTPEDPGVPSPPAPTSPLSINAFPVGGRPTDPQIQLHVSPDGGLTWHPQASKSLGGVGSYRQRVRWFRCGSSENMVLRFIISDPVPMAALDLQINAEGASA